MTQIKRLIITKKGTQMTLIKQMVTDSIKKKSV